MNYVERDVTPTVRGWVPHVVINNWFAGRYGAHLPLPANRRYTRVLLLCEGP